MMEGGRSFPLFTFVFWIVVQLEHNSKYKIFMLRNY
jgi:hypothetical protein